MSSVFKEETSGLATPHNDSDSSRWSVIKRARWLKIIIVVACLYIAFTFLQGPASNRFRYPEVGSDNYKIHNPDGSSTQVKVPLDVYVMSKCPDARDCLQDLIVPTMANISDLIDFKLEFIGSYVHPIPLFERFHVRKINDQPARVNGDDLQCKHGPDECFGNIIELCAAELYPDPAISLGFSNCMITDYSKIPSPALVSSCALANGIDEIKLSECIGKDGGAHGKSLLKESMLRTIDANVAISCTVRLNNQVRCIRDGGEWKNCKGGSKPKDLIRDVKKEAKRLANQRI